MDDFFWADRFRWTPEQADQIGYRRAERLRFVADAIDEGRAKAQAEAAKES